MKQFSMQYIWILRSEFFWICIWVGILGADSTNKCYDVNVFLNIQEIMASIPVYPKLSPPHFSFCYLSGALLYVEMGWKYQSSTFLQGVVFRGPGGIKAPQDFGWYQLTLSQPREADYANHICNTGTPGFSDLPSNFDIIATTTYLSK